MAERSDRSSKFSRRGFLNRIGVGTAATGMVAIADRDQSEAAEAAGIRGPGEFPVTLKVNGKNQKLNIEPRVTLLDALRNRLDLTGPKKVCDRGTCGACTVLVNGNPVYSCSMLAVEAEGHAITTVEGLGVPWEMNNIQKLFVKHDAQQCGFCTPGFVTACTAFIKKNPNPTAEDIRLGLGGNLCRCGTYAGILEVVAESAKKGVA
jgi:xanthine dehydrogenase YagT iron-sulfur-binding subunit